MPTIGVSLAVPEPWGSRLQEFRVANGDSQGATIPTHITLVPPSEVEEERLGDVERHLELVAAACPTYDVHLRGSGTFRPVSPVVFVNLVEGISWTEHLAQDCRRGPLALDARLPLPSPRHRRPRVDDVALDRAFERAGGLRLRVHRRGVPPLRPRPGPRLDGHPRLRADRPAVLMASPVAARQGGRCERARERWPLLDHGVRTQQHYGRVNGSGLAGSVTYFAFLSFFPILALAFFVGRLPRPRLPRGPRQPGHRRRAGAAPHRRARATARSGSPPSRAPPARSG